MSRTKIIQLIILFFVQSIIVSCDKNDKDLTLTRVEDHDGNSYKIVTIGTQKWMAENLKVTTYNDGNPIPEIIDNSELSLESDEGYCWYNNNEQDYGALYGALYSWETINTGKICPLGWHIPSENEWEVLIDFLSKNGFDQQEGTALKSQQGWLNDGNGNDHYGFKALPGGVRDFEGIFLLDGNHGYWWSSSINSSNNSISYALTNEDASILKVTTLKSLVFSCARCIMD